jgi:hypothetical protein
MSLRRSGTGSTVVMAGTSGAGTALGPALRSYRGVTGPAAPGSLGAVSAATRATSE